MKCSLVDSLFHVIAKDYLHTRIRSYCTLKNYFLQVCSVGVERNCTFSTEWCNIHSSNARAKRKWKRWNAFMWHSRYSHQFRSQSLLFRKSFEYCDIFRLWKFDSVASSVIVTFVHCCCDNTFSSSNMFDSWSRFIVNMWMKIFWEPVPERGIICPGARSSTHLLQFQPSRVKKIYCAEICECSEWFPDSCVTYPQGFINEVKSMPEKLTWLVLS